MKKRTDIHRPSAIIPADYEYVGVEYIKIEDLGDALYVKEMRSRIRKHMEMTGGTYSNHEHGGNCHICGAHCIYTVLFYHAKSNTYVRTGNDCAMKLDMGNPNEFKSFVAAVKTANELKAGKTKAKLVLNDAELLEAWFIYARNDWPSKEERTVGDIVGRLVKWGNISDKAINYLRILVDRIKRRPELEAKWAAEKAAADPCPDGRVTITGTVIKTEWRDTMYGTSLKMTVKSDKGFVVWGTAPASIRDFWNSELSETDEVRRGDKVRFTATVEPSDRDEKFGFFKRPSGAEITELKPRNDSHHTEGVLPSVA